MLLRHGGVDATVVSFTHQYPAGMTAQYADSAPGAAMPVADGDQLVLRVTALSPADAEYVPYSETAPSPTARYLELDLP